MTPTEHKWQAPKESFENFVDRAILAHEPDLDAGKIAAVARALMRTVKLGDCGEIIEVIKEACACGGGVPPDCCPACEVYHAIKEIVQR